MRKLNDLDWQNLLKYANAMLDSHGATISQITLKELILQRDEDAVRRWCVDRDGYEAWLAFLDGDSEEGVIDPSQPYGKHVELTCLDHPEKSWSTKNISPIGCRSIFYDLMDRSNMGPECSCSVSLLVPRSMVPTL